MRLKIIMCVFMCFSFYTASAYVHVLVNCQLTESGKQKFKERVQSLYGCSLSADHNYVLHGAGDSFSAAWDNAIRACSGVYTSFEDCSAMIKSCSVALEVDDDYPQDTVVGATVGTCECLADPDPETAENICTKNGTYSLIYNSVVRLIASGGNETCNPTDHNDSGIICKFHR